MNKKRAFSLIEAMIILALVSVAVMMLVPLLTQKSSSISWLPIRVDNLIESLTFGADNSNQRFIISPETGKHSTNMNAKFYADSVAMVNDGQATNTGIYFANHFVNGVYSKNNVFPNDSIILGMNACSGVVSNSIILKSEQENTFACSNNYIQIGNAAAANKLTVDLSTKTMNVADFITIEPKKLTVKYPNDDKDVAFEISTTATTPANATADNTTVNMSNASISVDNIYIGPIKVYNNTTSNNYLSFDPNLLTVDKADPKAPKDIENCRLKKLVAHEVSLEQTFCNDTYKKLWHQYTTSDKRLKNIIADYTKGIDSINKLETYLYTFKSDVKQILSAGIIAQKLKGVFDEALHQDADGYYSYSREPILYAMINSVKEIDKKQSDLSKNQNKLNKKANKLLRMYQ